MSAAFPRIGRALFLLSLLLLICAFELTARPAALEFDVSLKPGLLQTPQSGRIYVILSGTNSPEPRLLISNAGRRAPVSLARDVKDFTTGKTAVLDSAAFAFPIANLDALPPGDYFVQALFAHNIDLRFPNAPGNVFSPMKRVHLNPATGERVQMELDHALPPDVPPPDTSEVKFIKLKSGLLTRFHHRPIYLRAGVVLPHGYQADAPDKRYPLWVHIGGYGARYTSVSRLVGDSKGFRPLWMADGTPRFILLQLDGAGPFGDPYYVNSANNGPYGDALITELIPYIEKHFRAVGNGHSRVLSGVSTGGWVSLALQIFYPDFFNGVWSSCPDPVDFRAYERVNIYRDENAYADADGAERPSERDLKGNVVLTARREVGMENMLGSGNSYTLSGEQWGAWNAVYSPRGPDGLPAPLWDPQTGRINHAIANQWKKYDLRLVLEENWKTLGPKLRGKIHIASGEADQYYLNSAAYLLADFLTKADPPYGGSVVFGPGKGHGWSNLSLKEMLEEMAAATAP